MNNKEQTEEYEDIFYIFTFKEEDSKDMKIYTFILYIRDRI